MRIDKTDERKRWTDDETRINQYQISIEQLSHTSLAVHNIYIRIKGG